MHEGLLFIAISGISAVWIPGGSTGTVLTSEFTTEIQERNFENVTSVEKGGIGDNMFSFVETVPAKCSSTNKCGLIMDIHGSKMNAKMQEQSTHILKYGDDYINIRPQISTMDWMTDHFEGLHIVEAYLREAVTKHAAILDTSRIHVTGFSMGGFMAFNLLCLASDIICSIASVSVPPDGVYSSGVGYVMPGFVLNPSARGYKNCFVDGSGPNFKRSIMYQQGKYDLFFSPASFSKNVASMKELYGFTGSGEKLNKGQGVDWTRYSKEDVNIETAMYDFKTSLSAAGWPPGTTWYYRGHCIPSKMQSGDPNNGGMNCGNEHGYNWGEEVVNFFKANHCKIQSSATHNHGRKLGNGCPEQMPHRYPGVNYRCFKEVWSGESCNVDPNQSVDPPCIYAPRVCNSTSNHGKKLANGCPKQMPHRYPNNNRCFAKIWEGKTCNVNPEADPLPQQKFDLKCCYDSYLD